MADANTTLPYEALFRFDGLTGALIGAHLVKWRHVEIGGEIVKSGMMEPISVTPENLEGFGEILSAVNAGAMARIREQDEQMTALEAQQAETLEEAQQQILALQQQLAQAVQQILALQQQLAQP